MFVKKEYVIALAFFSMTQELCTFFNNVDAADIAAIEIDQESFEKEVLQSDLPVIVDVYATWCFPCQILKPIFAQVAREFKDSCKMVIIDYHKNIELTSTLEIRYFPTMLIYFKGKIIDRFEGFMGDKETLSDFVQKVIDTAQN
ncbi:MAG TPA: thioredoxin domain-containing protein [Candidatus Saccharimonadales bacterium]|nr:thioredoxin domain-containing protein [Candidatus Saccharimonadales bacterium]